MASHNAELIYRTTGSVVFWTKTTEEAQAKLNAMENMTGADDGDVLGTIEWMEAGKPESLPPVPEAQDEGEPT
jgi:uncharacterized membrane protein